MMGIDVQIVNFIISRKISFGMISIINARSSLIFFKYDDLSIYSLIHDETFTMYILLYVIEKIAKGKVLKKLIWIRDWAGNAQRWKIVSWTKISLTE